MLFCANRILLYFSRRIRAMCTHSERFARIHVHDTLVGPRPKSFTRITLEILKVENSPEVRIYLCANSRVQICVNQNYSHLRSAVQLISWSHDKATPWKGAPRSFQEVSRLLGSLVFLCFILHLGGGRTSKKSFCSLSLA